MAVLHIVGRPRCPGPKTFLIMAVRPPFRARSSPHQVAFNPRPRISSFGRGEPPPPARQRPVGASSTPALVRRSRRSPRRRPIACRALTWRGVIGFSGLAGRSSRPQDRRFRSLAAQSRPALTAWKHPFRPAFSPARCGDAAVHKPAHDPVLSRDAKSPGPHQLRLANKGRNGEGGIRTPESLRSTGFQDRRLQPLGHLSSLPIIGRRGSYAPLHVISLIMRLPFWSHNPDCD
jgi:hypothetical protein